MALAARVDLTWLAGGPRPRPRTRDRLVDLICVAQVFCLRWGRSINVHPVCNDKVWPDIPSVGTQSTESIPAISSTDVLAGLQPHSTASKIWDLVGRHLLARYMGCILDLAHLILLTSRGPLLGHLEPWLGHWSQQVVGPTPVPRYLGTSTWVGSSARGPVIIAAVQYMAAV